MLSFCLPCYLRTFFSIVGKSFDSVVQLKSIFSFIYVIIMLCSFIFEKFFSKDIHHLIHLFSFFHPS